MRDRSNKQRAPSIPGSALFIARSLSGAYHRKRLAATLQGPVSTPSLS